MIKRPLISLEEAQDRVLLVKELEKKLVPRLKGMAYVFFVLSLLSFFFAIFIHSDTAKDSKPISLYKEENSFLLDIEAITGAALFTDMEALEVPPQEIFNFYIVASIFSVIGISLWHFSTKRLSS
jgi:hypothetical protein